MAQWTRKAARWTPCARARKSSPKACAARPRVQAPARKPERAKTAKARQVGELLAQRAKEAGIAAVVFDRGGYRYHGRIAALADGAREGGLQL